MLALRFPNPFPQTPHPRLFTCHAIAGAYFEKERLEMTASTKEAGEIRPLKIEVELEPAAAKALDELSRLCSHAYNLLIPFARNWRELSERLYQDAREPRRLYEEAVSDLQNTLAAEAGEEAIISALHAVKTAHAELAPIERDRRIVNRIGDYAPHGEKVDAELPQPVRREIIARSMLGDFRAVLQSVAARSGKKVLVMEEPNTSRTCHDCGTLLPEPLRPEVQEWTCPGCGTAHRKHQNAACNILTAARHFDYGKLLSKLLPERIEVQSLHRLWFDGRKVRSRELL